MMNHNFSSPHPHAKSHTPPAKNTRSFIHHKNEGCGMFNISLSLNADRPSCLYLFSHHTQANWDYLTVKSTHTHTQQAQHSFPWHVRCSSVYQPRTLCQSSLPASTVTLGRRLVKLYSLWWKDVLIPIPYSLLYFRSRSCLQVAFSLGLSEKEERVQTEGNWRGLFISVQVGFYQGVCPLLATGRERLMYSCKVAIIKKSIFYLL